MTSKTRSTREAVWSYHTAISEECVELCSSGAVLHDVQKRSQTNEAERDVTQDKRVLVAPASMEHEAEQLVDRLTDLSSDYCARFERSTWRSITPPTLIKRVNAATLYKNAAFSVCKLTDFDRDYQLGVFSHFLGLALKQWSELEIENAGIRTTLAQIDRYRKEDDLYTFRHSGFSFRLNAVTDDFTGTENTNLNQLVVLVGQSGIPNLQTRNDRKRRGSKERIARIHFSGGSVIDDSRDLTLLPYTLY